MTNDLVKRLHDKIEASKIYDDDITLANIVKVINREELFEESADRIEKLEAALVRSFNHMMEDGRRIEQLEAALREIADGPRDADKSYVSLFHEIQSEARKALEGKENEKA